MSTITFDTQELVIELENSGFTRQQSETVVTVLKKAQGELATKRDIDDLRRDIDARFVQVDARFIQLEQRLIIKLGALIAFAIGIVAVLVKLL
jgi:hypothetical protein